MHADDASTEQQTFGRYRIVAEIGRGGMGVVYRALDPAIGRVVAIKAVSVRPGAAFEHPALQRARLNRELRLAGAICHPNVVATYDATNSGDTTFVVMEYVDGQSLDSLLTCGTALDAPAKLSILRQVASALDYLHANGIVHRDVKPANVLIAARGTAKLTDFGIARSMVDPKLTAAGMLVGTPHYMAPEQLLAREADSRSDQFAFAVIAWHMLTGRRPFEGTDLNSLTNCIVHGDPPAIPSRCGVEPYAERALRKALSKNPDARYASCTAFIQALEGTATPRRLSLARRRLVTAAALLCMLIASLVFVCPSITLLASFAAIENGDEPIQRTQPQRPEAELLGSEQSAVRRLRTQDQVRQQIARITSVPNGATVILDRDSPIPCMTPCSVPLPIGRHTLSASLPGFRPALKIFTLPAEQQVSIVFEPQRGALALTSTPPGAEILVDGISQRKRTPALLSVSPGRHVVQLVASDGSHGTSDVAIADGQLREVHVSLSIGSFTAAVHGLSDP